MGKKAEGQKVPVTERAVVQRINRKLRDDDQVLKVTRGERARLDLGDFYILNWRLNVIADKFVDPEEMGRELGVLQPWERVIYSEARS